jgi:hypothetical protein
MKEGVMTDTQISVKSGKGISDGVVSELTAFFGVQPGHEEQLRAACQRFADALREARPESHLKTGLRDWKHVIFDNGRRLMLITTFDTEWDPYIDDAVSNMGVQRWIDWMQHTVEAEQLRDALRQTIGLEGSDPASSTELEQAVTTGSAELKRVLQAAQVPATAYFTALSDLTMSEVRKGQRVERAFQQVLDDPAAGQALQQPALGPLLEQAAD